MQLEIKHPTFSVAIVNSKRSALGKRGVTGGIEVNYAEIPASVLNDLLNKAVTDFLQVGLKTVDKDKATTEDCQAAMRARLDILKAGATTKATERKPGAKDPIREAARKILKKTLQDMIEEKVDAKTLNKEVTGLFKAHREWLKTKDPELEGIAQMVEDALSDAKADLAKAEKRAKTLASVVSKAREHAIAAQSEAQAAKPKAVKASPTEKVKAEKAKTKPAAR